MAVGTPTYRNTKGAQLRASARLAGPRPAVNMLDAARTLGQFTPGRNLTAANTPMTGLQRQALAKLARLYGFSLGKAALSGPLGNALQLAQLALELGPVSKWLENDMQPAVNSSVPSSLGAPYAPYIGGLSGANRVIYNVYPRNAGVGGSRPSDVAATGDFAGFGSLASLPMVTEVAPAHSYWIQFATIASVDPNSVPPSYVARWQPYFLPPRVINPLMYPEPWPYAWPQYTPLPDLAPQLEPVARPRPWSPRTNWSFQYNPRTGNVTVRHNVPRVKPPKGVDEKKSGGRAAAGVAGAAARIMARALGEYSEAMDILEVAAAAAGFKGGSQAAMLDFLFLQGHIMDVDPLKFASGMVWNQIEDAIVGRVHGLGRKARNNLNQSMGYIGYGTPGAAPIAG